MMIEVRANGGLEWWELENGVVDFLGELWGGG